MHDIDVWRTADIMMKEYGDEAGLVAARRALENGDVVGCSAWKRVADAISWLEGGRRDGEVEN